MAMAEKVRILLVKRKITVTDLAKRLGMSQSNLSNKLSRARYWNLCKISDLLIYCL